MVSFRLDAELLDALRVLASRKDMTVSDLLRSSVIRTLNDAERDRGFRFPVSSGSFNG